MECLLCNSNDECLSCNNEAHYYAKSSEIGNNPINCYDNLEGYYVSGNYYEPCYETCQTCEQSGDSSNHNCLTCKSDYSLRLKDNDNHENCYPSCSNYYYIDESNVFHCVTGGCPSNYKLVDSTKKCVRNCMNEENNQYEYNDVCYSTCPEETNEISTGSYICDLIN